MSKSIHMFWCVIWYYAVFCNRVSSRDTWCMQYFCIMPNCSGLLTSETILRLCCGQQVFHGQTNNTIYTLHMALYDTDWYYQHQRHNQKWSPKSNHSRQLNPNLFFYRFITFHIDFMLFSLVHFTIWCKRHLAIFSLCFNVCMGMLCQVLCFCFGIYPW